MKKQKRRSAKNPASDNVPVTIKLSVNDLLELDPKILHYAKGNRSLFLRTAALKYVPKKGDF